ncbi:hypothetical protein AVEN_170696-1 [Araneus ventricosus]|uniref:Uncharacterized protein n=1 Tax=Araneus ventricosus TaxID=182803 RepID=A0A4Y2K1I9_ARAVE|nr:hypothetical protein AVEN_170696-1 [Araneus ventricosus]
MPSDIFGSSVASRSITTVTQAQEITHQPSGKGRCSGVLEMCHFKALVCIVESPSPFCSPLIAALRPDERDPLLGRLIESLCARSKEGKIKKSSSSLVLT